MPAKVYNSDAYYRIERIQEYIDEIDEVIKDLAKQDVRSDDVIYAINTSRELEEKAGYLRDVAVTRYQMNQGIMVVKDMNWSEYDKYLDRLSECLDKIEDEQSERALISATKVLDEIKTETGYYDRVKGQ